MPPKLYGTYNRSVPSLPSLAASTLSHAPEPGTLTTVPESSIRSVAHLSPKSRPRQFRSHSWPVVKHGMLDGGFSGAGLAAGVSPHVLPPDGVIPPTLTLSADFAARTRPDPTAFRRHRAGIPKTDGNTDGPHSSTPRDKGVSPNALSPTAAGAQSPARLARSRSAAAVALRTSSPALGSARPGTGSGRAHEITVTSRPFSGPPQTLTIVPKTDCHLADDLFTGKHIGHYLLGQELGSGHFSVVYHSLDLLSKRRVAVKAVKHDLQHSAEQCLTLHHEVDLQRMVRHENVLQIHDVMQSEHYTYIVTELAELGEFFTYLPAILKSYRATFDSRASVLPESFCRVLFVQVCSAVAAVHAHDILHRDIKLENVLVNHEGVLKLADFGLAIPANQARNEKRHCGSPHYMAPELLPKRPLYSEASDIWALGVTLYIVTKGCMPFQGPPGSDKLKESIMSGVLCAPRRPAPVTPELEDLYMRVFAEDPCSRLSAAEILAHPWVTGQPLAEYEPPSPKNPKGYAEEEGVVSRVRSAFLSFLTRPVDTMKGTPSPAGESTIRHEYTRRSTSTDESMDIPTGPATQPGPSKEKAEKDHSASLLSAATLPGRPSPHASPLGLRGLFKFSSKTNLDPSVADATPHSPELRPQDHHGSHSPRQRPKSLHYMKSPPDATAMYLGSSHPIISLEHNSSFDRRSNTPSAVHGASFGPRLDGRERSPPLHTQGPRVELNSSPALSHFNLHALPPPTKIAVTPSSGSQKLQPISQASAAPLSSSGSNRATRTNVVNCARAQCPNSSQNCNLNQKGFCSYHACKVCGSGKSSNGILCSRCISSAPAPAADTSLKSSVSSDSSVLPPK